MTSKREWRWVVVVGALALALTSIPYLLGLALETPEKVFGGFVYAVEDVYSYLAKMRQGAEGAWLFHIPYTPEPHPGALFFPFHLLLGRLAALLPGDDLTARMVGVYHGARLLFGMGLLLTVYRFLAAFTADVRERRLAFLLVTFGGGLGWLLVALGQPGWLDSIPLDFFLPEGFTFLVLYAFPHIALAGTLLLWGILYLLSTWGVGLEPQVPSLKPQAPSPESFGERGWYRVVLAGGCWLVMGLIVPFYVAIAWAVTGAMGVALLLRKRRMPWREAGRAVIAGLLSAPIVVYSGYRFTSDPVYETWAGQNLILSPHPFHYLVAFGLLFLLALLVAPRVWREGGAAWTLLAWVAVVPFLVYLPFNLQRRLVEGVQIPLSLLAARMAVEKPKPKAKIPRGVWAVGLLVLLVPTNGLLVGGNCMVMLPRPMPIFRDLGEVTALDWLSGQAQPDEVVMAAYETGNYLPARVGARVFVGHGPETVRFAEKMTLAAQFFDAATDDAWRLELLTEYGLDWVFWGPAERALGEFDPNSVFYLEQRYQADGYAVFAVVR